MSRFSETLLDHARSPRNGGRFDGANAVGSASLHGKAPRTTMYLRVADNIVTRAQFEAFGCGVTIACCSALTELLFGRTAEDCRRIQVCDVMDALDGIPADKQFCAELARNAMQNALSLFETSHRR